MTSVFSVVCRRWPVVVLPLVMAGFAATCLRETPTITVPLWGGHILRYDYA